MIFRIPYPVSRYADRYHNFICILIPSSGFQPVSSLYPSTLPTLVPPNASLTHEPHSSRLNALVHKERSWLD
ncbi:uncharacterized protein STEHIDRAFT_125325 [Stereum hirsutum FP-91666 SS1]|uniref:uncharacterized protein n=1 Tax=Stereum hirsutum (strain FP-91666) TaxID=721885 RepID=UPI0004449EAF|nr:uncharacterized protein STEHIDRAFT_125325 [Stereum hirsutum FP-91666 SS1]EIM81038.1 hypothetical protein STEHIDRAFT_125325 [Stereum hirsutum FP-91666 SS1]